WGSCWSDSCSSRSCPGSPSCCPGGSWASRKTREPQAGSTVSGTPTPTGSTARTAFSALAILEKEDIFKGSECLETSQHRQEDNGVLCWEARGSASSRCMPTIDPARDTHPPDHPDVVPRRRPRRKDTMVTSPGVRPMQDAAAAVNPRGTQ